MLDDGPGHVAIGCLLACVVALLFALHPAQTEAITYISGRSASLMAMFYLAGVLAYDQARTMADRPHATSWPWHSLALGCFVAAVASKETALTWPLALLLWDAAAGRKTLQHLPCRTLAWYAAVLVLLCGVLATHTRYQRLLAYSAQLRTLDANLYTQVAGLGHLLLQWCLPWRSNIDPDLPVVDGGALANVGVLACVAAALWSARRLRRHPTLAFAILWWLLQLLPIYVLLPRVDVVNDRQLYLAAWPGLVPLVLHAQHLLERPRLRMAVAALSVAALAWLSVQRNLDYRSEVALWQSTVRLSPHKARPFNNLGYALFQTGDYAGAEAAYLRALALEPDYWLAQRNLDLLETRTGHTEE